MAYHLRNFQEVERVDCSCGWSRRPFANHPAYNIASLHGTIFTIEKEAFPHFHIPVEGRNATHETYLVTDENTRPDALIYLGKGAVEAVPGVVVYIHPGVIHGGVGSFTPLILGVPGFVDRGNIEIDDPTAKSAVIQGSKRNIIIPKEYIGGFVLLTAEEPVLSFSEAYGKDGITILLAQTRENRLYCARCPHDRLTPSEFENVKVTYITVLSGEGTIKVNGQDTKIKKLDTLLLESGTNFSINGDLSTAIMAINPISLEKLLKK